MTIKLSPTLITSESTVITAANSYNKRIDSYNEWSDSRGNIFMSMRGKTSVVQVYRTSWFHFKTDKDCTFHYGKYVWVLFQWYLNITTSLWMVPTCMYWYQWWHRHVTPSYEQCNHQFSSIGLIVIFYPVTNFLLHISLWHDMIAHYPITEWALI